MIVDGCVSTARGSSFGPRGPWTIVVLNSEAQRLNRPGFDLLMNTFPATPRVG